MSTAPALPPVVDAETWQRELDALRVREKAATRVSVAEMTGPQRAAVIAAILVAALVAFSQYTKQGRAMRAVADDHQAALSVGISLQFIWIMVWSIAGFVALGTGTVPSDRPRPDVAALVTRIDA